MLLFLNIFLLFFPISTVLFHYLTFFTCFCFCVVVSLVFSVCFHFWRTSLVAQTVKHLSTMRETWVQSLGWEDPLEKEMAIHSSTLAWKIPWTEEPGRLQSLGSQRGGHDWATSLSLSFFFACGPTFLFGLTQPHYSLMCGYVFPCLFISSRWWTPWRLEQAFPKKGLCQLLTQ